MVALRQEVQDRLFGAADTVCLERARLVTEAWRAHEAKPPPLRRALALAHVLEHMTLDLHSNPLMAGNTSSAPRAWMLVPEFGFAGDTQVGIEHDELQGFLDHRIPADLREFWAGRSLGGSAGTGHLAVDGERVVRVGLAGVLADVEQPRDGTAAQQTYRQAMAIALRAVMRWAERYAEAAEQAAAGAADAARRAAHRRVAEACRQVPAGPARNLFEGLQALALTHLATAIEGHGMSISIGLPDRALAAFADEAAADPDGAAEAVGAFLLTIAGHSLFGRGSKTQAITVGGADHLGRDCCNAVTHAFLTAFDRVPVSDPHLFLRWHRGLDSRVWRQALDMLARARSMPLLINDEVTAPGFDSVGFAPEDAWDYCVIGCNELGVPGRAWDSAMATGGGINHLALCEQALWHGSEPADMAEVEARLADAMLAAARGIAQRREPAQQRLAAALPTPFTTALMRSAAHRGEDLLVSMPYRQPGWFERGLSNAANALAVIETLVLGERSLAWSELTAALAADLPDDRLMARLRAVAKWGNDDERVDRWALRLLELRTAALRQVESEQGLPPHMPCHVVRSLHHVDGQRIGASPDGRRAGQPVGDSLGAVRGTDREGPSALLNSVLKVDTVRHYPGGTNLNVTLPTGVAPTALRALCETFLGRGGQELQVNCLDAARLRAAQASPEHHRDLVVRVAGLSARFVELARAEQQELIERAELAAR